MPVLVPVMVVPVVVSRKFAALGTAAVAVVAEVVIVGFFVVHLGPKVLAEGSQLGLASGSSPMGLPAAAAAPAVPVPGSHENAAQI